MMADIAVLILVALTVGFALHKSDDSNFQVAVVPAAVGLLLWLVAEGQRGLGGAGIALGTLAYVAVFLFNRARRVPMPDYQISSAAMATAGGPPLAAPAPSGALRRTPACPDGPYYMPNTPEKRQIAAKDTLGERMNFSGRVLRLLGARPCNEVLVEAGPTLAGAFISAGLWDEILLYLAPKLLGASARPLFGLALDRLEEAVQGRVIDVQAFGPDLRVRLARV